MYDEETDFYYLNSRYYDPETGRFINADGYISTGQGVLGYNMFAYCLNNPVNYVDQNGTYTEVLQWWTSTMWWLCGADAVLPVGEQGSNQGNYHNPQTGESWHPDLKHPDPIGPHWDYRDPSGIWWRVGPDGMISLK